MTSDAKTRKPAATIAPDGAERRGERAPVATRVRRDEALAIAAGLTEAERDLVAGIVDWQIEGLGEAGDR
jgi:hypothetical protein